MRRRIGPPAMQIAIFKQPWRIKVKGTLPDGSWTPLLSSASQHSRDVNAIEQLRTAREATTINSCGYRCAGGQCAQPGTAYRRSRPDCGLFLKLEIFFEIRTASWASPWCARRQLRRDRCFVDFGGAFSYRGSSATKRSSCHTSTS